MNDLFKKINVLVKSTINDVLGEAPGEIRRKLSNIRLGDDIDREVATLRGKINDALDFETGLQKRVQELQAEITKWDAQADEAVAKGDEANGRYAVEQMQRAQQRLVVAQSDLKDHQLVTEELITKVNTLESAVADARRAEAEKAQQNAAPSAEETTPAPAEESQPARVPDLSNVLKDMREKITQMGDVIAAKTEIAQTPPVIDEQPVADDEIDDDLAARRQRLSKPK